jgi:type VI protein secretion system component Hcp
MKLHSTFALALALFAGSQAIAANLAYVVIPGVPGSSVSDKYARSIDASSVSVSVANRLCTGFTVVKSLDAATAPLANAAVSGVTYPQVTVYLVKTAVDTSQNYATYLLQNSTVTSITSALTGATFNETVTFAPATIVVAYREPKPDGALGPDIVYTLTCTKPK